MSMRKALIAAALVGLFVGLSTLWVTAEGECGVIASGSGAARLTLGPFDVPGGKTLDITARTRSGDGTLIAVIIGGGSTPDVVSLEFTSVHTVSIPGPAQNVQILMSWQTGSASGNSYTITVNPCEGVRVPPDDRINWDMGDLNAVLYAREDNNGDPVIEVYRVGANGQGEFLGFITEDDLAPYVDNPPDVNTEIKAIGNVMLYALASGEFQVNIGPDGEGKVWSVIFDGLPPEKVYGYEWDADGE